VGWRIRKVFRLGPFRWNLSRSGVGVSWGIPGFRYGINAYGRRYISIGLPGTGIYFYKYLDPPNPTPPTPAAGSPPNPSTPQTTSPHDPWWTQEGLQ
jgi:hypothetical protein